MSQVFSLNVPYTFDKHLKSTDVGLNPGRFIVKNMGPYPVYLYSVWNGSTVPAPTPTTPNYANFPIVLNVGEQTELHLDDDLSGGQLGWWAHAADQTSTNLKIWSADV